MDTILLKTKHRVIPLFYKTYNKAKNAFHFNVMDPTQAIYNDLRRIGAKGLSYVNGKSRLACSITGDVLVNMELYLPYRISFSPELNKLVKK